MSHQAGGDHPRGEVLWECHVGYQVLVRLEVQVDESSDIQNSAGRVTGEERGPYRRGLPNGCPHLTPSLVF